jgi:hypothetical protein
LVKGLLAISQQNGDGQHCLYANQTTNIQAVQVTAKEARR